MHLLYNFSVWLYLAAIHLAAPFNAKARMWLRGRKNVSATLKSSVPVNARVVWFHASSLGEFEQGRPVIEAYRTGHPEDFILLTFFSPSGYEIRKNYNGADLITYMPIDTPCRVRKFLKLARPSRVFFIKYEFWFNYIRQLHRKQIPLVFFPVIFRPGQHFFAWYGVWFRNQLKQIQHIFVQDKESADLLSGIGYKDVTICGDTRFDRVAEAAAHKKTFPAIEEFVRGARVMIAGSTWPADEDFLATYIRNSSADCRFIVAPHEIVPERIEQFRKSAGVPSVCFTQNREKWPENSRLLILDTIGILLHVYQYGSFAYIGGGFGKSIHNILEAACFGLPVIFGPRFEKFKEARDLSNLGGAFPIVSPDAFPQIADKLFNDQAFRTTASETAKKYVNQNLGAVDKILGFIGS